MTRLTRALLLAAGSAAAFPVLAAGADDDTGEVSLARIEKIVVDGEDRIEAGEAELSVTRARTHTSVPARRDLALNEDDEIATGAGTSVVLLFEVAASEEEKKAVVGAATRLRLQGKASIFLVLGRILSNVRGFFEVARPEGVLGAHGTEFEVVAADDGSTRLLVLEGTVEAMGKGPAPERDPGPEAPVAGGVSVTATAGRVVTSSLSITVRNGCEEEHIHEVRAPEQLPWVSIVGERFAVPGGGIRITTHTLKLDATRVSPGTYRGDIAVKCLDCGREARCRVPPPPVPLTVTVQGPPDGSARDPAPRGFSGRVGPLEEVMLGAGRAPETARKAGASGVRATLDWSSDVLLAGRPPYVRRGAALYFESVPERDRTFKDVRFRAVWNQAADAYETLGNVYCDWGEGAKGLEAYLRAGKTDPARASAPAYLAGVAEAYRLKGRLDEAEERVRRALRLDPRQALALLTLGNLEQDQAAVARDRGDNPRARELLSAAARTFDEAARSGKRRDVVAIARANQGETSLALGQLALQENRGDEAHTHFAAAQKAFATAQQTHRAYPYSDVGLADSFRGLFNLATDRGEGARAESNLREAEDRYGRAVKEKRAPFAAWTGLGTLYHDAGRDDRAAEAYARAVELKPSEPLAHWRLGMALARSQPIRAAEHMRTYLALEAPAFKQGQRAKEASTVAEGKVAPPTPPPSPGPTPVKVPDVLGDKEEDAVRKIRGLGLVARVEPEASCERPGRVVAQEPRKDTRLSRGSEVRLRVTGLGPSPVTVPMVERLSQESAERRLRQSGLQVGRVRKRQTETDKPGTVVDQDPEGNKPLAPGCPVELTVAEPMPLVSVPDFRGTKEKALQGLAGQAALALAGLTLGRIEGQGTGGVVADQEPKPGARVPRGTPVNLWIRADPTPGPTHPPDPTVVLVPVPDVTSLGVKLAVSRIRQAGLSPAVQDKGPCVIRQAPESRQGKLRRGSTVTLYTGNCPPQIQ